MHRMTDNMFMGVGLETTDIVGANATSAYLDMREYDIATFLVVLAAAWNAGETLDGCKLVQATDAGGTGVKDIAGKAPTVEDPSAAGEVYSLEVKAEDLDLANGYTHVACYVSNAGAAVLAPVTIVKAAASPHLKYENKQGATART